MDDWHIYIYITIPFKNNDPILFLVPMTDPWDGRYTFQRIIDLNGIDVLICRIVSSDSANGP